MFNKIYNISADLRSILSSRSNESVPRLILLTLYLKFRIKLLLRKIFLIKWKREFFFGLYISFLDYKDFFALWREIFVFGNYYFKTEKSSPLIIDCGSNIGMSVLFFKFIYPSSRIICFEPDPDAFSILKKNIDVNCFSGIELHNAALGSKDGVAYLHRNSSNLASPGSTIMDNMYIGDKDETIKVDLLKLSSFIKGPVDFLKMDIEGAEYDIFDDIKGRIHLVDAISMEIHSGYSMMEKRMSNILESLEDSNFTYIITQTSVIHREFIDNPAINFSILLDAKRI